MNNESVRIQDDLYQFVNGEWLKNAVIPADRPTTGGFSDLNESVEKLMMHDFDALKSGELSCDEENMKKAVKLYSMCLDSKKRKRQGIKPLLKHLKKIDSLRDVKSLNRYLADFVTNDYPLPFAIGVDANMKDTTHHSLMLSGPSIILPDTAYYKPEMAQQKQALFGLWSNMASALLGYTKLSKEDQELYLKDTLAFDEIIATLVKSSEEWSEYTKMYNPMKVSRVARLLKPIKFKKMIEKVFEKTPEEVIVADPRFLNGFNTLFNEENFNLYKHWAYVTYLCSNTGLLSEDLRVLGGSYRRALSGIKSAPSLEKFSYRLSSSIFSEPVGLYYGRKYFGEKAKKDVVEMCEEIIETYKKRVKNSGFLEDSTKDKAVQKLSAIVIKMGYPDKSDEVYDKFAVDEEKSLFDNVFEIKKVARLNEFSKLYKDVNRTKWVMPGHMVNACYNPFTNDITFPAAILQAPFYSIEQSRSENLGGIGAVIGHEISHAFDNNGAQCDERGNLNNWWTKSDLRNFKKKTKEMVKQFDGIELPFGKVNGNLVVSENIADNGGMAVTLAIMKTMKDADYKGYFYNWARVWCQKASEEYSKMILAIDVHSPCVLRANMQPRNFEEWYETFHVTKKDKMYIAPSKRIIIW